jgi:hypothetical protein
MSNMDDQIEQTAGQGEIGYARMLVSRLERLSVDSYWAHRSSGLRGSLLRALERMETQAAPGDFRRLRDLIDQGAVLLEKAAREIRGDESRNPG